MKNWQIVCIVTAAVLVAALTFVIGIQKGYERGKAVGFSNGMIAAVKCQKDPDCHILGPTNVKAGETKELGSIKMKNRGENQ